MVAGGSSTAAPQPLADGGPCSPSTAKSFAQLFSQPIESPIQVKPTTKYKGEAAVVFSKAEADKLATPFRWALVGKFSYGRPSLEGDSEFHVKKESALVPVWASLPALPVHYFDKHSLFSILAPVGKPLFLDSATAAGMRPSVARVCVEAQVVKQREAAEAVEEAKGGVSTPGEIGDSTRAELMVGQPSILAGDGGKSQADTAAEAATTDPVQQPVRSLVADATLTLLQSIGQVDGAPDWDRPIGPLATEGVLTEQVEAGVEGMRSNAACGQLRESGQDATAAGQEGQVACDGREGTLDGEQGVRDTQQADAGQLILLHNSELGSLVVDLSGREEVPHDSQGDVDIGLSPVAGNLSPRLVVRQERVGESAVVALNIDQSQAVERDAKQARGKGVRARIPSDRQLRSATSSHNSFQAKFVAICEPKLDVSRIESIRLRLHFDFVLVNCSGDIWVFYNSLFVCSMVGNSSQHLSLSVQSPLMPGSIIMSFVHAKCSVEERRELWSNLVADKPSSLPWCIGGDFNVIMAPHEKRGGRPFAVAEGVEFMSFLEEAGVFDVGFSGPSFTWCNNRRGRARVSKRLDRLLVNAKCLDFSAAISVVHLARHPSNHAPLKISFASLSDNKPRPFRFLNVWTTKPDLLEVIRHAWGQEASGSPLRVLCSKLLAARRAIQVWNKQCFGNVIDAVREAEQTVQRAEEAVDHDDSEAGQVELRKAQAELRYALSIEEQYWSQKARVKWLRSGDRNSRYFHAVVRQRRAQGLIHRIKKSNGDWVDTDAEIASEAITYFSNLFAGPLEAASDMLHLIPPLITTEDNCMFEAAPNIEEVHQVVRAMDGDSAAGPDGFTGKFYTFAWEVIAQDVYNAVLSFFYGAELPRFVTSTSIVLLPKVSNPQDLSQFRPISLCNFFNKLLSRILADRVAGVLPRIISPQQSGFVKGRNISENYLLAQEVVVGIGKKARGGNVVLKLDMSKAYDRVSWLHIIGVLRRFGFGERFIDMGDPLSPTLFIIAAEVLSRGLNALMVQSGFLGFKVPYGCPSITHLAFADDVLIFANGSSSSLKDIMQVLEMYQRCSGQLISAQKNGYLVHPSLSLARRRVIERVTGFTWQPFPIRYLGFPLYFGRCKSSYYAAVGQSILGRVLSWKSKFLSAGGKMVLIKHVLSSMPVHLLSAAVIPTSIFKSIEQVCSNFLWGSTAEESKFHWIRWTQLCYPVEEGGVGFRRLRDVYTAFSCKLWWSFRTGTLLWAAFMHAKYCRMVHPGQAEMRLTDSAIWRRMLNVSRHVELSMVWLVNDGSCHFWYDNWLGSGALCLRAPVDLSLSFCNFITNGHWDASLLSRTLPGDIVPSILQYPVPDGGCADEVIWVPSTSGTFTLASAFRDVRQARNTSVISSKVWHPRLPLKVSFFMLRLLRGRLPLPDALCRLGFHLPSKCFCCHGASEESIEHVFAIGHVASENSPSSSLRARIVDWWLRSHNSAIRRFICLILPSFICWHIWKARNKAVFEGEQMRSTVICQSIFSEVKSIVDIHFKQKLGVQTFCQLFDWSHLTTSVFDFKLVRWEVTAMGGLVLNTDGCSKGNPGVGGGGGVLRDSTRMPLVAFLAFFRETTCLRAETLALLIGLQTCVHRGFINLWVESDSLVLVGVLQRRIQCPWQIRREVRQIWRLVEDHA
ncbi:uncharacterized protein [Coffea arabica]|uniref:Reverse transcriptase domain-containing protein n=1 Tax=Coffea arabica TaxID=13443 RepID=A0A6P6VAA9_COFAR